jgi:hypothetical protein
VAHWSRSHSRRLIITDKVGRTVDSLTIPAGEERPSEVWLGGTMWAPYPGAEWDEEPPGCWSVAVFRDEITRPSNDAGGAS